ncbi:MAG: DUF1592 domain-containing protein [Sandaracinaceae bacterium]
MFALALVGCSAQVTEPTYSYGETATGRICDQAEDAPGAPVLRRLTGPELEATVRAVFELDAGAWSGPSVPPDPASADGLPNNAALLRVNATYASRLQETGEAVGEVMAVRDACVPDRCVDSFLERYGERAYRRPLTDAERQRFVDLHELTEGDDTLFVRWATSALVQSPHLVYRAELGDSEDGGFTLDDYEIATLMAYGLTGAPPDDALRALAAAGELSDLDRRREVAEGLAYDADGAVRPAFRAQVLAFARAWLGLAALDNVGRDPAQFPDWSPEIRTAMREEVEAYVERVLIEERGSVQALFANDRSVVSPELAAFYGWPSSGNVARPEGWGTGLLSLGGILAMGATSVSTSPTQRGYFVRTRVLCGEVPPPPAVVGEIPEPGPSRTTRERYESIHAAVPQCAACHRLMDPIGFGFEHLDATGRYRADENGLPIDDSGFIEGDTGRTPFEGPDELVSVLTEDPSVGACVGSFLTATMFGVSRLEAQCLAPAAHAALSEPDAPLIDLYVDLIVSGHGDRRVAP